MDSTCAPGQHPTGEESGSATPELTGERQPGTVENAGGLPGNPARTSSRRLIALTLCALAAVAGHWCAQPAQTLQLSPGPVTDLLAVVEGAVDVHFPPSGTALLLTVRAEPVSHGQVLLRQLQGRGDTLLPVPVGQSGFGADAARQMRTSQTTAAALALALSQGRHVADSAGVQLDAVAPDSVAARAGLAPDLVLQRVNGIVVRDVAHAASLLRSAQRATLELEAGSGTRTVALERAAAETYGLALRDRLDAPPGLSAQLPQVGGPSGGMMLTLAFYDALTSGDLFAAKTVAGTGTISPSGAVGPVGAVSYKAQAAERAGADVLFVPAAEVDQARRAAPALTIVPISKVSQALDWLCAHGASSPYCRRASR